MIILKRMINNKSNKIIFTAGGWASMILIIYSLATMLIVVFLGGYPETVEACYKLLHKNKLVGLLRLDILTVFVMPLYYLFFYSIYKRLKSSNSALSSISLILIFAGLTLFLASPSVFSFLHLSEKYVQAVSEDQKNQILAAGEAILAMDMWHGTSAVLGGLLLQTGALLLSLVMLYSRKFTKLTAYSGIIVYGLDLLHIILGFFIPPVSYALMAIAGPVYLLWFLMVGLELFKLKDAESVH